MQNKRKADMLPSVLAVWSGVIIVMLSCMATTSMAQVQIDLDCLPGWEISGHHCYKLFVDPLPWASAQRVCVSYGAHLATPFDYYENEAIGKLVKSKGVNKFWIGADRIGVPPNDNRRLLFNGDLETRVWAGYWSVYQPKFTEGDCVSVTQDKKQHYKWSFGPCEENVAFLCQRSVCAKGSFHCINGNCVSQFEKCDGHDDCGDRYDETDCPTSCSWHLRGQGSITYPGSSTNYSNNANCAWLIEADFGFHVQLTMKSLSLEKNNDELIIMDGGLTESSSVEITRLTGQPTVPLTYYSSDNKMLVQFRSDGSVTSTGFILAYSQVKSVQTSQNLLNATDIWQEFEFPNYGNNYLFGNQDLFYVIQAEASEQTVSIEVLDIDLPNDATAVIRDGKTVYDKVITVLTGSFRGSGIAQSTGRYMYIALHTIRGSTKRGLKIRYIQGCRASMNQSTGYISSPGYPETFYSNIVVCNWTVTVPEAKSVTLLFNNMNLSTSAKIQIFQWSSVIGNYTGSIIQNPLRITSGQFTVLFTSSKTHNSQGFNLTYSVDCPKPVIDLSLSELVGTLSESYGSEFTVSCKQGSRFSQAEHKGKANVRMICLAYGVWNVNTSPKCERNLCPPAPGIQNGYLASSVGNLTYNGTLTYKCYNGFKLIGLDTVTCSIDGQWVNPPSCQPSDCGPVPSADQNGSVNITAGDGKLYGSILQYSCNDGYNLIGDPTLFCDSNGTWMGKAGTCQILTCYIRNIQNGVLSANKVVVGQPITLTCNPGYRSMSGVTTMTCNSNRTLTPMLTCENINECDNRICQHHCVDTNGSYYCTCNSGFQVTGNNCTDIDECGASKPCSDYCTNTEGSYYCSCPAGFSLFVANGTQGYFIPSSEDGTRAGDMYRLNHTCVRNLCPVAPDIANGVLLSQKTKYYYGDRIMYKCLFGYILENPLAGTLQCSQNANWTGLEIKCSRALCAVDPVPVNLINPGMISPHNASIGFGEEIIINCTVPGFTPQTFLRKRRCTLIGKDYRLDGNREDYECGFISCGKPQDEPGSIYTGLTTYYYRNTFTFNCQSAFSLEGVSVLNKNNTVTCQDNGQWDFGNLSCTGIQCLDPGQPYLGKQVSSDYREGQLVSFTCTETGYELQPPYPISCIQVVQNGTGSYNSTLPTCVDVQKPNITNCPQSVIFVPALVPVSLVVPELQIQDNGGIRSLTVSPAWPSSQSMFFTPLDFTFTVTDYGNNTAICKISLRKKDVIPPTIICPLPVTHIFNDSDTIFISFNRSLVTVKDNVTPTNLTVKFSSSNYTFNPDNLITFPPTHYQSVIASVEDAAGNSASCNFGVLFQPDVCSPYSIRKPLNGDKVCTAYNGGGYGCTVTCKAGYNLFNNVLTSVNISCSRSGESFNLNQDIKCVNLTSQDGSYKLEYDFTYDGSNISNSCRNSYEAIITNTLATLTTNRSVITTSFCETGPVSVQGKISLGFLTIKEAEKKVLVRYVITFDRRPGAKYVECATSVKLVMQDPRSYLPYLEEFKPMQCDKITVTSNRSLIFEGFYCEDNTRQLFSPNGTQNLSYCLECPEGRYSQNGTCKPCPEGTYSEASNMKTCQQCPPDTSTYRDGAVSRFECASKCTAGSFSSSGLPPCYLCPPDTYWVNATTCLSCPANTTTRGNGSKTINDCKETCRPGTYNEIDGHAPCTECPLHYYNDQTAALRCFDCPADYYTNSTGKTNANDCLMLNLASCLCQQQRFCRRSSLPHVWSCSCDNGWTGEYCNKSLNPCTSHPCYNGGVCSTNGSTYTCTCPFGTSGQMCEQIIKTCTPNFCLNKGMCENLVNRSVCHCLPGFTGDRCQIAQDICAMQPCKNGGYCTSYGSVRYSCTCPPGFTGKTCEESKDDCYTSPCRNNGTCHDDNGRYNCSCDSAYTGQTCELRKTLCPSDNCGPGAKCFENEINNTYICVCNGDSEQVSAEGMNCTTKDLCANKPCMNNGNCVTAGSYFYCTCPSGYDGSLCQHNINDCLNTPCQNGGRCQHLNETYQCNCSGTGFQGEKCSSPVDDCISQQCNVTGTESCVDMINTYRCHCKSGYTGNYCETDINECDSDPCLHNATCLNYVNDYACQCPVGWTGKNCESEEKLCTPTTCQNGAMCFDYFNGYFCQCSPNTYDKNCTSSVNICQIANPCVHGNCSDMNGKGQCTCYSGYEGDRCELRQNFCFSNVSTCKNGGQCFPQLDNFECKCPEGYLTKDCSFTIDHCGSSQCPVNSVCYDIEGITYCRCPLDKEGPNCDKDWDQNFDLLFDHWHRSGMAYLPYPVKLNSSSFSISIWLQYGRKNDMGTFLSLMTVEKANSLRGKHLLLWIDENTVYYNSSGTVVNFTHDINYSNDGKWHYLVVNVNRTAGVLHLIVDTINSPPVSIPTSETFDDNMWPVLGVLYDPVSDKPVRDKGFYGKLSRVTIYSSELLHRDEVTILGNTNVSNLFTNSILRWSSEFKYSSGVIRKAPSEADTSCPFGYTGYPNCNQLLPGKTLVKITSGQCPDDIIKYSPNRLTQVFFPTPTFIGQDNQVSSVTSGDTFVWGKYSVIIKASNADGNTALCLFNIYVQNDQCTSPRKPPNAQDLQCSPAVYEKYKQCALICENNTAPSIASPYIHTCGPVGNWDPENKYIPYRITPCGAIAEPMRQIIIHLQYSVPTTECTAATDTLKGELQKTQVNLNKEWNRVCTQANCNDTVIDVICLNKRRKRQATAINRLLLNTTLTLNNITDTVISRMNGTIMKTEDLYRNLIMAGSPGNPFDYSSRVSDAVPSFISISNSPLCNAPKVLLENQCVDCGPGTFYNDTEKECQFCPVGSYQPLSGQISCTVCPDAKTTETTGSYSSTDCYSQCPAGQYMNLMNNPPNCTNCSRGFYQPYTGQFSCLSCPADKTTKYTGTIIESDCSNDCPPGQEIGSSNNCTPCRIGFYRGPNDAICQKCPDGYVTQNVSEVSVSACSVADNPPGTRRIENSTKLYELCPVGTYQNEKWQSDCIPCSANYLTDQEGSTNVTDCKFFCPAGQEKKLNEDSCEPCELGFYRDGTNTFDLCTGCKGPYLTLNTGSTSPLNCTLYRCQKGEQPNAGNTGCDLCPLGTYQEFPDKQKCDPCGPGKSTRSPGATHQDKCESYCPSGSEKNGTQCQECTIGYYKDNKEDLFGNCTLCKNSSYVTASIGSTSEANCTVLNCVEGFKTDQSSQTCVPCPRGTFQNQKYQNDCISCSPNEYTRQNRSTRREDCETYCPPGFEKNGTSCVACPRGFYKDNTVDVFMACTACDSKYVTPPGLPATNASQCTVRNCQAGSYINGDNCTQCPRGFYQDQPWQTNCTQCGLNRNTEKEGATSSAMCLLSCKAGTENNGLDTTCSPCMAGYYKDIEAATKCTPCANFTNNNILISIENGSTSISNCTKLVCLPGYYSVNNICTQCDFGTYQPQRWNDNCTQCPLGSTTYKKGAISATDCESNCSLGEGLVNGTCRKCEIGFYNNKSDQYRKDCSRCPDGKITLTEGAISVTQCNITDCSELGQYRDPNTNMCKNCIIGTYQDKKRQDACISCPSGFTTQYEKSTSVADCKRDCDSGYYFDNGTGTCMVCPVGFYRNKTEGDWSCVRCSTDLTTPKSGSGNKADCSVATCTLGSAYDKALGHCRSCPQNTYADHNGQFWPCTLCPNDQVTDTDGATSLASCRYPCSAGDKCNIVTQVCVNIQSSYRCDCRSEYVLQNGDCIHKCNIPNYCGNKGECIRSPFECKCKDSYSGALCDIRPDASSMSDQETETIIIAVVTTVAGLLFIILLVVCICVIIKKRASMKTQRSGTSEIDEHTSIATRSLKDYDNYPTFAVNPAFSSKPPSVFNGPNGALPSYGVQMYSNPTYSGDEDNDPAVYKA